MTKVVVLGNTAVGKTSIIRRFAKGEFVEKYRATIGADFLSKTVSVKDENKAITTNVVLQIWDTAGQERFRALSSVFFRGADACILVCSVDDRNSLLQGVPDWHAEFSAKCSIPTCLVLAITKTDVSDWQFTKEEVENLAASLGIRSVQFLSALNGQGVDEMFNSLATAITRAEDSPRNFPHTAVSVDPSIRTLHAEPQEQATTTDNKLRDCLCRSC